MQFSEIIGQTHIKQNLKQSADQGRIPHAQLFVGPEGTGTLATAIAYAHYLLSLHSNELDYAIKFKKFTHPDLHFAFPVTTSNKVKSKPISNHYIDKWRLLLKEQPYANLFDWYKKIGTDNKQGQIGVDEAHDIVKKLALKSYEGGYKIMIIWMAEYMNTACANKLLKLIEEPPKHTVFLLIVEDEDRVINTIKSRCQTLQFPPLPEFQIAEALMEKYQLQKTKALGIAHQANGNFNKACDLVYKDSEDLVFESWFVTWIRAAFRAKGNKSVIKDLLIWSEEVAKTGRETQKTFLSFCLHYFRQALLLNYGAKALVYIKPSTEGFKLENFAPFVHEANILEISEVLQEAIYHIERNGNSKLIFTDISIQLTRLIHKKSQAMA